MANRIEDIKRILKAGSKASKYRVKIVFPSAVAHTTQVSDMALIAKSAEFPGMTIGQIEVFVQGRKIPIPGDTTYANTWTLTFYTDDSHNIRKDFINWMKSIDNFQANTHTGKPSDLMVEMSVTQLDSLEKEVAEYVFKDVWPQDIGTISVGADQLDTLEEFDVTFSFSSWIVNGGGSTQFSVPLDGKVSSDNSTSQDQ